jgi:DNA-binding MarR family transcriptional regulator
MVVTTEKSTKHIEPEKDELLDLYVLFAKARHSTFRAREKELQRYNISPEQAQVIFAVQQLENRGTVSDISRHLFLEPHTITGLVNRMADKGLVRKFNDLKRKNLVRVALTRTGTKSLEIISKAGPIRRILGVLNQEEREELHLSLEKILFKAREELGMDRDNLPPSE